jgi:hypothetical protein
LRYGESIGCDLLKAAVRPHIRAESVRIHQVEDVTVTPDLTNAYVYRRFGLPGVQLYYRVWFAWMWTILGTLLIAIAWLIAVLPEPKMRGVALMALPLWSVAAIVLERMRRRVPGEIASIKAKTLASSALAIANESTEDEHRESTVQE